MINMIAAVSKNRQIGINNQLPWHIREDLQNFKKITLGQSVLMGRKTFESMGRLLPNRQNIILSRDPHFIVEGATILHSFEEALDFCKKQDSIFIIGGGDIYTKFLPYADKLYLTLVDKIIEGDTNFPNYEQDFICIEQVAGQTLSDEGDSFTFTLWDRKTNK